MDYSPLTPKINRRTHPLINNNSNIFYYADSVLGQILGDFLAECWGIFGGFLGDFWGIFGPFFGRFLAFFLALFWGFWELRPLPAPGLCTVI